MGAKLWYEVSCDNCGSVEHFIGIGGWKVQAKSTGWIVNGNRAFCKEECEKNFKEKKIKP